MRQNITTYKKTQACNINDVMQNKLTSTRNINTRFLRLSEENQDKTTQNKLEQFYTHITILHYIITTVTILHSYYNTTVQCCNCNNFILILQYYTTLLHPSCYCTYFILHISCYCA